MNDQSKLWVKLAGISLSITVVAGGIVYFVCSDYMAQALWEKAQQISSEGMRPDPTSASPPDESERRDRFMRSAIAVASRIIITTGWSIAFALALFALLCWLFRTRDAPSYVDDVDSVRLTFLALADEVNKVRPPQTKKDWADERKRLTGQVSAYKSISLDRLRYLDGRFPRRSVQTARIRDTIVRDMDQMEIQLSHNHDQTEDWVPQLRASAKSACDCANRIKQIIENG